MKKMWLYNDAGDGGSVLTGGDPAGTPAPITPPGSQTSWKDSLPDDLKSHPSLNDIADVTNLAKSYVHGQSLIGADKVPVPKEDSPPEVWDEFYKKAGRPEKPEDYGFKKPDNLPEGFEYSEQMSSTFAKKMHELGLNKKQAEGLMKHYFDTVGSEYMGIQQTAVQQKEEALNALKTEWGATYNTNIEKAKKVVTTLADEEFKGYLNESGLGDDPRLIKAFAKIGDLISEDKMVSNDTGGVPGFNSKEGVQARINQKMQDPEFFKAYTTQGHVQHRQAVDEMKNLYAALSKFG